MCKILLSIKPEYVEKIIKGEKLFEFRRTVPKRKVDIVVIYSTFPEKKIVGEFKVKKIHKKKIKDLWDMTKGYQGIEFEDFNKYYINKEQGYAYEIKDLFIYNEFKDLEYYNVKNAPQSFIYLN